MKIYFTASISAKKHYLKNYLDIVNYLKKKGHTTIYEHIIDTDESQINLLTREDRLKFHNKLEKWIKGCDFMIAETSFPSISVGYEISLALRVGKPVLILYSEGDPPSLLAQHKDEKLVCERYKHDSYKNIIDEFIEYIEGKSDLRFTFFITSEIIHYLDEVSRKQKVPKSVYLRNLIEQDMDKNRF